MAAVLARPSASLPAVVVPLAEEARGYAMASKAENTRIAYRIAWRDFLAWCDAQGLLPLPAAPATVGLFLTDRARTLKVASLQMRLVAMAEAHRMAGHELDTRHPAIRDVWAGIRRAKGAAPVKKEAITGDVLRDTVRALATRAGLRPQRDRAMLLVGFAAALRRSELVALDVGDLRFSREGVVLRLRRSKTDQEGSGAEVAVPFGTSEVTCPVRALRAWIAAAGITEGPVFVSITRGGRPTGTRLGGRDVALAVKAAVGKAGYRADDYAGHSLRSGFATSAARAGVPEQAIMNQTRHKSLAVMRGYVRRGGLFRDNAAGKVGL